MHSTRRPFLQAAAAAGSVTLLPFAARAAGPASDVFTTDAGDIAVHPAAHASVVLAPPPLTRSISTRLETPPNTLISRHPI